jgi:hypothetical protein
MTKDRRFPSPFYSNPILYNLLIRFLYQKNFNERYQIVAENIPQNSSVVDVCAGDAYLYSHYLKKKSIRYIAVDNSPNFVKWGERKNIDYRNLNVYKDDLPNADFILMMGSLFQFIPNEKQIVQKMISSSKKAVIITEPISNLSSSHVGLIAKLANSFTTPFEAPASYSPSRFNKNSFEEFLHLFPGFQHSRVIAGGREMIAVFKGESRS